MSFSRSKGDFVISSVALNIANVVKRSKNQFTLEKSFQFLNKPIKSKSEKSLFLDKCVKVQNLKNGINTTIHSYYDMSGNLGKRVIYKTKGDVTLDRIEKEYITTINNEAILKSFSKVRNECQTTHSNSGVITQKTNNVFLLIGGDEPSLFQSRYNIKYRGADKVESQLFSSVCNKNKKFLEKTQITFNDGKTKSSFYSNTDTTPFEKDKYFVFRGATIPDFISRTMDVAQKSQFIEKKLTLKIFDKPCRVAGFYLSKNKSININTSKFSLGFSNIRSTFVNVLNHECRHAFQDEIVKKNFTNLKALKFLFGSKDKTVDSATQKLARAFRYGELTYSAKMDDKKYINNILEKDARKHGENACEKFVSVSEKLKTIFPNMPSDFK